jgi:hypothetical protein
MWVAVISRHSDRQAALLRRGTRVAPAVELGVGGLDRDLAFAIALSTDAGEVHP